MCFAGKFAAWQAVFPFYLATTLFLQGVSYEYGGAMSRRVRIYPDFEAARKYALRQLMLKLPRTLFYHSLAHTRDDVVPASEFLAAKEGVVGEALLLLLTASYYHDIGFVYQSTNHELISARVADEILPRFGYGRAHIHIVHNLIITTQLPQKPTTLLERIIADADLDVLGREDFLVRNQALRAEMALSGLSMSDEVWLSNQLQFLQAHRYFTAAAKQVHLAQKQHNIAELTYSLNECRARNYKKTRR